MLCAGVRRVWGEWGCEKGGVLGVGVEDEDGVGGMSVFVFCI